MNDPIKRVNFFENQLLYAEDFNVEHTYHTKSRSRLHGWGIARGLEVHPNENNSVKVDPGVAVDAMGRVIVLSEEKIVNVEQDKLVGFVTIALEEEKTDPVIIRLPKDNDPPWKVDADFKGMIDGNLEGTEVKGPLTGSIDGMLDRSMAGHEEVEDYTRIIESAEVKFVESQPADGGVGDGIQLRLAKLTRNENSKIQIDRSVRKYLEQFELADGSVTEPKIADGAVTTGKIADKAVTRDKLSDPVRERVDHAVQDTGDTMTGALYVGVDSGQNRYGIFVRNGHPEALWGLVAQITESLEGDPIWTARTAVGGVTNVPGVCGGYFKGPGGSTLSLLVEGRAQITGGLVPGHVVDTFINASGQTLKTGDVVKLKGTPVTRFHGDRGAIPIPEVTLADKENDPAVIGIVDSAAASADAVPEHDIESLSSIPDGSELYVVTLGSYYRCRADTAAGPIAVGDLLTSSPNPGHAQKAIHPTPGALIGKALQNLENGTGYVAVFVNTH